jgi:hypothetical protein
MSNHTQRKRGNWCKEEEREIIKLRKKGYTWEHISSQLPGRTKVACSRHYEQYLTGKTTQSEFHGMYLLNLHLTLKPISTRCQKREELPSIRQILGQEIDLGRTKLRPLEM